MKRKKKVEISYNIFVLISILIVTIAVLGTAVIMLVSTITQDNLTGFLVTPYGEVEAFQGCTDTDGDSFNQSEAGCGVVDCDDSNATIRPLNNNSNEYINNNTLVCYGTYNDTHVIINTSNITFDCNDSTLDGVDDSGNAIDINGNVNNTITRNCEIHDYESGFIHGQSNSHNHTITNCTIYDNSLLGIYAESGDPFLAENNIVYNNPYGIGLEISANGHTVSNNTVYDSSIAGILIGTNSGNCTVTNNTVYNNPGDGILISSSYNITIANNTIYDNTQAGINISSDSENSTIYNNNFTNNTVNGWDDNGSNYWNTSQYTGPNIIGGQDIGGNYYDDYSGVDTDGDGIGETDTYSISGGGGAIDNLPLTNNCTDLDGDGYSTPGGSCGVIDCDDNNATIHPLNNNSNEYITADALICTGTYNDTHVTLNASNIYLDCNESTLNGTDDTGTGIYVTIQNNTTIKNCIVTNYGNGITLSTSNNNSILNVTSYGNAQYGIILSTAVENEVNHSTTYSNTKYGIYISTNSNNNIVYNNTVYTNQQDGIRVETNNNLIDNNTAYSNYYYGLLITEANNNATNNVFYSNAIPGGSQGGRGFGTSGASDSIYENNTIYNNEIQNVMLINSDNITLKNNTIYSSVGSDGVRLQNTTNSTINNNSIYSNSLDGIYLTTSSTDNNITGNFVYDNTDGIEITLFCENNTIYDNNLSSNSGSNTKDKNSANDWNISESSGPNMIGGLNISGNYYDDYTGYDSDGDGIGQSSYSIGSTGGAIDYGPLTNNVNQSPVIFLMLPVNTTNSTSSTNVHTFNATDVEDAVLNCTLYYNSISKSSNLTVTNNTATNLSANVTSSGTYTWWINCSDGVSENKSEEWLISITLPATPPPSGTTPSAPGTPPKRSISLTLTHELDITPGDTLEAEVKNTGEIVLHKIILFLEGLPSGVTGTVDPSSLDRIDPEEDYMFSIDLEGTEKLEPGIYPFSLKAISQEGATALKQINITVTEEPKPMEEVVSPEEPISPILVFGEKYWPWILILIAVVVSVFAVLIPYHFLFKKKKTEPEKSI